MDDEFQMDGKPFSYVIDCGVGDPTPHFKIQREYNGYALYVNSEFYKVKHDVWGDEHHKENADAVANRFDLMLKMNESVNF